MASNIQYLGNGRYRFRISKSTGKDQKLFSQYFSYEAKNIGEDGKTEDGKYPKKVTNELAKFINDVENDNKPLQSLNITFEEFVKIWFRDYASRLAPKTRARYEELLKRIIPSIGHIKIQKITPTHINSLYNNLGEIGIKMPNIKNKIKKQTEYERLLKEDPESTRLSNTTIHRHHELISAILGKAVQWDYIKANPATKADPPQICEVDHKYLDDKTITLTMSALSEEPLKYQVGILLDIFTGLRRGELLGLNWNDIDWEKNAITINKASQYISGSGIFEKTTKTKNSIRKVKVPAFVMEILKLYKEIQDEYKKKKKKKEEILFENDKIFIQSNGKPMHPDTFTQWFPKFLKKNNIEHVNFHGLRHTNASLMMAMGFDIVTAASRLGDNKATYLKVYAHMFESTDKAVADAMDDKYNPNAVKKT